MSDILKIEFKIFLEAEDVSQSRIASCSSFVKNAVSNHKNPYIKLAEFDDENDMEDFALRFYVEGKVEEEAASNPEAAEGFLDNMAELLDEIAHMQSFADMEGSFSISYEGESLTYDFVSEGGSALCDYTEK